MYFLQKNKICNIYDYLSFVKLKKYDIIDTTKGTELPQFLKNLNKTSLFVRV